MTSAEAGNNIFSIPDNYDSVSVEVLHAPARHILSKFLDVESNRMHNNKMCDFYGLGELMGFDYHTLRKWKDMKKGEPLKMMLLKWPEIEPSESTVGNLLQFLLHIDRKDVFMEVKDCVRADVELHRKRETERQQRMHPVQVDEVSSFTDSIRCPPKQETFDAYLSFDLESDSATQVVREWQQKMQQEGLRCFIGPQRHLFNDFQADSFIKVITKQCRRLVIFVTSGYEDTEECRFQMQYVRSMDATGRMRKVVPVLLHKPDECRLPDLLQGLRSVCWYRQYQRDWIWEAFVETLKSEGKNCD